MSCTLNNGDASQSSLIFKAFVSMLFNKLSILTACAMLPFVASLKIEIPFGITTNVPFSVDWTASLGDKPFTLFFATDSVLNEKISKQLNPFPSASTKVTISKIVPPSNICFIYAVNVKGEIVAASEPFLVHPK
ncbi:hypothetical protein BDP27DRAFT_1374444 [Rhodocollybia butyracea]|uniref:Uncharacterized protein n=1 Tax=Rhodocollybia butyracea TaxID=206335 RepID=A0A9P5P6N1_9AGAR|nr:hypothetical protein BDP27DRAFT_1374444 [Rhodocollybia butyracea]